MSNHVPGAPSVCIHSVCIDLAHRRRGIALGLLKEYTRRLGVAGTYDRILLIAHEELRELYERAGFEWVGRSAVVHGARPWYEMRRVLKPAPEPAVPPQQPGTVPAGLWEALQRASGARTRPQALAITAFPNGAQDLVADDGKGTLANKFDLLCPREGCGSVILKNGVASLVERASVQLDPPQSAAGSPLAPLPTPPSTMNWWLVTPNAMMFENIGFTRAVVSEEGKRIKLLICAECDLGPLGWCEEGGSEFWLATSRVGYRQ
ncbi:Mss4-like protein [Wolfiporia cocos MD-104 SS10]|uniref:Mss4-like protein n=1 Tax=Wolfiporia cocos (strain MD-104) TaxID=742152 RepID=A0A2H3JBJ1_WOLCO|nr:Mss4-like protein [Wolfiporia cocos MD-104 SS10]